MSKRLVLLSTLAACGFCAAPALAHPGEGSGPSHGSDLPPGYPLASPMMGLPPQPGPEPAVSSSEYGRARAGWIDECVRNYDPDRRDRSGGVVGGVLGAAVGGLAGNRIAGNGSRLAGTLLGGGVGAIAGAIIGSAIDSKNRSKAEDEAVTWCEDYLARNTVQAPPVGYAYPMGAFPMASYAMAYPYGDPVMMQPVMIPVQRCHEVVEKTAYRTIPARRVVHEKRVQVVPTKVVKTVKTAK